MAAKEVFFAEASDWEKEAILAILPVSLKPVFFSEKLQDLDNSVLKKIVFLSPFIYSRIDKSALEKMPLLKAIATRSTGTDHIDLAECKKRKIAVLNVPSYGENTVAEHTFGLILALSRKIYHAIQRAKKRDFSIAGLRGFDLKGKTLGIVGMGHIGLHVARIARGFEMNVIAFDPFPNKKLAKRYCFKYVSFGFLLKNSDIITLHAPYNERTHHLINKKNILIVKKGAVLINTARGGLVETEALLLGLKQGILSAAGLDVLEEESAIMEESQLLSMHLPKKSMQVVLENHALLDNENVLITPHNAFNSKEAMGRIVETTVKNLLAAAKK